MELEASGALEHNPLHLTLCYICYWVEDMSWDIFVAFFHNERVRAPKWLLEVTGWEEFVTTLSHAEHHLRILNRLNVDFTEVCAPLSTVIHYQSLMHPCDTHRFITIATVEKRLFLTRWASPPTADEVPSGKKSAFDSPAFKISWVLCNNISIRTFASGKCH